MEFIVLGGMAVAWASWYLGWTRREREPGQIPHIYAIGPAPTFDPVDVWPLLRGERVTTSEAWAGALEYTYTEWRDETRRRAVEAVEAVEVFDFEEDM